MADRAVAKGDQVKFLSNPPKFLFFTGKGGVGKTSVACATALYLARRGGQVLLVSTDPASNIGQVFGVTIGNTITKIDGISGLSALEIDPEEAAAAYRERILTPVRGLLPEIELAAIAEQLSGSCTTEVASFNEFTNLLADPIYTSGFDHVVFDTAPTGHTIRLLQLPGSWTQFLEAGKGDASCLGPLSGLEKQRAVYSRAVSALTDPSVTRLVLVTRAQSSTLQEVARTFEELNEIGIHSRNLVINGILPADGGQDILAQSVIKREGEAMATMPARLSDLDTDLIELKARNMVGVEALDSLFNPEPSAEERGTFLKAVEIALAPLSALIDELEKDEHGLVMCMGKGGVGKTTIAAAIAVALAHRGHEVTLTTTDPAAHLMETLQGNVPGLEVSRIDPAEATRMYRERVMATKGKNLDEVGRAALKEDLLSPCTEEVAVFQQFSKAVHESRRKFVVIDTAPTGHTLLLLDATGSYHREVSRQMGDSVAFTTPLMRLQDPSLTKMILVTLAEPTPVMEAEALQADLKRAGISTWAWVINNSIAAAKPESTFLRQRAENEIEQIKHVKDLNPRIAIVPLLLSEPTGERLLGDLANS